MSSRPKGTSRASTPGKKRSSTPRTIKTEGSTKQKSSTPKPAPTNPLRTKADKKRILAELGLPYVEVSSEDESGPDEDGFYGTIVVKIPAAYQRAIAARDAAAANDKSAGNNEVKPPGVEHPLEEEASMVATASHTPPPSLAPLQEVEAEIISEAKDNRQSPQAAPLKEENTPPTASVYHTPSLPPIASVAVDSEVESMKPPGAGLFTGAQFSEEETGPLRSAFPSPPPSAREESAVHQVQSVEQQADEEFFAVDVAENEITDPNPSLSEPVSASVPSAQIVLGPVGDETQEQSIPEQTTQEDAQVTFAHLEENHPVRLPTPPRVSSNQPPIGPQLEPVEKYGVERSSPAGHLQQNAPPTTFTLPPVFTTAEPVKRKPGRPRKVPLAETSGGFINAQAPSPQDPSHDKSTPSQGTRGRKRKLPTSNALDNITTSPPTTTTIIPRAVPTSSAPSTLPSTKRRKLLRNPNNSTERVCGPRGTDYIAVSLSNAYSVPPSQMPIPLDLLRQPRDHGSLISGQKPRLLSLQELERAEEEGRRLPRSYHSVTVAREAPVSSIRDDPFPDVPPGGLRRKRPVEKQGEGERQRKRRMLEKIVLDLKLSIWGDLHPRQATTLASQSSTEQIKHSNPVTTTTTTRTAPNPAPHHGFQFVDKPGPKPIDSSSEVDSHCASTRFTTPDFSHYGTTEDGDSVLTSPVSTTHRDAPFVFPHSNSSTAAPAATQAQLHPRAGAAHKAPHLAIPGEADDHDHDWQSRHENLSFTQLKYHGHDHSDNQHQGQGKRNGGKKHATTLPPLQTTDSELRKVGTNLEVTAQDLMAVRKDRNMSLGEAERALEAVSAMVMLQRSHGSAPTPLSEIRQKQG